MAAVIAAGVATAPDAPGRALVTLPAAFTAETAAGFDPGAASVSGSASFAAGAAGVVPATVRSVDRVCFRSSALVMPAAAIAGSVACDFASSVATASDPRATLTVASAGGVGASVTADGGVEATLSEDDGVAPALSADDGIDAPLSEEDGSVDSAFSVLSAIGVVVSVLGAETNGAPDDAVAKVCVAGAPVPGAGMDGGGATFLSSEADSRVRATGAPGAEGTMGPAVVDAPGTVLPLSLPAPGAAGSFGMPRLLFFAKCR